MLVEDDQVDVKLVKKSLEKEKISNPVIVAENGEVAIDILKGKSEIKISKPYIVLLDINMPKMDGHEFLTEVRADQNLKDSIVFMLTTSKAQTDIEAAYKNNVAGYLLKHRLGEEFLQKIKLLKNYLITVEFPTS